MKNNQKLWIAIFLLPTCLILIVFYLVPLLTVAITGFTSWNGINGMSFIGFDNYKNIIFKDEAFLAAIRNTIIWIGLVLAVHVPFGVIVAFIISKKRFLWKFTRSVYLIPGIISSAAWAVMYIFIYKPDTGILNSFVRLLGFKDFYLNWMFDTRTALISLILTTLFYSGYVMLLVLAEILSISPEIKDAAVIDGASDFKMDIFIILPCLRNIIGVCAIMEAITALRTIDIILITTRGGPGKATTNLPLMIYNGILNYQYGYANALATIMILLGALILFGINRTLRMNKSIYE